MHSGKLNAEPPARFWRLINFSQQLPARRHLQVRLVCLALAAVTLLCYWPLTHHDFINYDDPDYIPKNPHVTTGLTRDNLIWAFGTGYYANWHPLTWISHMADCQLYGLNAGGHHLTNLLFHIANTLLLFLVLNRMTGTIWRSAFVAALFAWHPLHVESVAWASERKDVLSTFFFLLTLGAYAKYAQSKAESPKSKVQNGEPFPSSIIHNPSSYYLLALLFFILGLMSKPMVVTLPFVLLLLDYWPLQRFQIPTLRLPVDHTNQPQAADGGPRTVDPKLGTWNLKLRTIFSLQPLAFSLLLEKIPFFALALCSSIITFLVQKAGGAVMSLESIPLPLRIGNALIAYVRYISNTVCPIGLAPFYPYETHWPEVLVLGAGLLLTVWSFLILVKARTYPYLPVGWCWFLGTLVPTIGLVQVGVQSMADRYMYIPSIGLFLLVVWGLCDLRRFCANWSADASPASSNEVKPVAWAPAPISGEKSWPPRVHKAASFTVQGNRVFVAGCLAALTACLISTRIQLQYWQNAGKLFAHTLQVTSGCYFAYACVGKTYDESGQKELARACYSEAVRIAPHFVDGQYNLGTLLLEMGETDEAIKCFKHAITDRPSFARAHNNLAKALLAKGQLDEAIENLRRATELEPKWPEAHYNLGTAFLTASRIREASTELSEALRLDPANVAAHMNLAVALVRQNKPDLALNHFAEATRLAPENSEAYFNYGLALLDQNQPDEAVTQFAEELRLRPDEAKGHYRMAVALVQLNKPQEAALHYRETLRLAPDFAQACDELASLHLGN
jgi:tetratricopeptide (TPR) repeat protein